jgi:hypothetical protein
MKSDKAARRENRTAKRTISLERHKNPSKVFSTNFITTYPHPIGSFLRAG